VDGTTTLGVAGVQADRARIRTSKTVTWKEKARIIKLLRGKFQKLLYV
jgi:hypothetical protein